MRVGFFVMSVALSSLYIDTLLHAKACHNKRYHKARLFVPSASLHCRAVMSGGKFASFERMRAARAAEEGGRRPVLCRISELLKRVDGVPVKVTKPSRKETTRWQYS